MFLSITHSYARLMLLAQATLSWLTWTSLMSTDKTLHSLRSCIACAVFPAYRQVKLSRYFSAVDSTVIIDSIYCTYLDLPCLVYDYC